jgi:hypothetical protein
MLLLSAEKRKFWAIVDQKKGRMKRKRSGPGRLARVW